MRIIPTPSQTAGPFFKFGLDHPEWSDLTEGGKAAGERIRIEGRVLDGDGAPVPDALLEIWQANAAGKYRHAEDRQEKPLDPHFRGFGRCATDRDGRYHFTTIRPGAVPGRGNAMQAPHINLRIFARGLLKHISTRIYFAEEPLNRNDPVLNAIESPTRQRTLIASAQREGTGIVYQLDIRLQGKDETVFFDI